MPEWAGNILSEQRVQHKTCAHDDQRHPRRPPGDFHGKQNSDTAEQHIGICHRVDIAYSFQYGRGIEEIIGAYAQSQQRKKDIHDDTVCRFAGFSEFPDRNPQKGQSKHQRKM